MDVIRVGVPHGDLDNAGGWQGNARERAVDCAQDAQMPGAVSVPEVADLGLGFAGAACEQEHESSFEAL